MHVHMMAVILSPHLYFVTANDRKITVTPGDAREMANIKPLIASLFLSLYRRVMK